MCYGCFYEIICIHMEESENSGIKPKERRPRSAKDWAYRCRIWVVCAWLKARNDRIDDKFDDILFPRTGINKKDDQATRRRLFSRMRLLGDDPEDRNRSRGFSVIKRFDTRRAYRGCARLYKSVFWDLIIPPGLDLLETRKKLETLAKELNIFCATLEQRVVGRSFLPNEPAFQQRSAYSYKKFVKALVRGSSIDDLAMLGLMYREALLSYILDDALFLRQELAVASARFCQSLQITHEHQALFEFLIERRLIRNRWDAIEPDFEKTNKIIREVEQQLDRVLPHNSDFRRDVHRARKRRSRENFDFSLLLNQDPKEIESGPWVPLNSRLKHFINHYEIFDKTYTRNIAIEHIRYLKLSGNVADSRLVRTLEREIQPLDKTYKTIINKLNKRKQ